jgi:hypothetical protein
MNLEGSSSWMYCCTVSIADWRNRTIQQELLGRTNRLLTCTRTRHGSHRKRRLQQFFVAAGTSLPSCYLATIRGYTDTHDQQLFYCCVYSLPRQRLHRVVTQQRKEGYTLPNRCLATIWAIHIQAHRLMGGIYEVRRWDGLSCQIYIPSFIKIGSGIQILIGGGGFTDTQTAWRSHKPTFIFSK